MRKPRGKRIIAVMLDRDLADIYGIETRALVQAVKRKGNVSLIKRGMVGTFHKVSAKYLPLYVAKFQFRYNNRENDDIFGTAISGC